WTPLIFHHVARAAKAGGRVTKVWQSACSTHCSAVAAGGAIVQFSARTGRVNRYEEALVHGSNDGDAGAADRGTGVGAGDLQIRDSAVPVGRVQPSRGCERRGRGEGAERPGPEQAVGD